MFELCTKNYRLGICRTAYHHALQYCDPISKARSINACEISLDWRILTASSTSTIDGALEFDPVWECEWYANCE